MAELNVQNKPAEEVPAAKEKAAPDISRIVIIYEEGAKEPYKLINTEVLFDAGIEEDGSLVFTGGKIRTDYLIQNTELEKIETWRYIIHNVKLKGLHVDAAKDEITYDFTADSFEDQTFGAEE